jgi:hypothetical protein
MSKTQLDPKDLDQVSGGAHQGGKHPDEKCETCGKSVKEAKAKGCHVKKKDCLHAK